MVGKTHTWQQQLNDNDLSLQKNYTFSSEWSARQTASRWREKFLRRFPEDGHAYQVASQGIKIFLSFRISLLEISIEMPCCSWAAVPRNLRHKARTTVPGRWRRASIKVA